MHIDMETELVFTVLIMTFVLCVSYLWIVYATAQTKEIRIGLTGRQAQSHIADTTDGDPCDDSRIDEQCYAKAAQYALQRHVHGITNISAVQVSPQLYSNHLISAETFSMISTRNNLFINKDQMLVVYDDLKSKVALCSSGIVKFVDILRSYPEYEGLANDLQGTYHHKCSLMKLPIPKTEASSCDVNKNESNTMPFTNTTSTEAVMLEAKLNIIPNQGYCSFNEAVQRFSQHCNIQQSFVCMIVGKNCVTVKFQVSASSLPILEKKITDSEQFLSSINISVVKILDKTIFESDSHAAQKSKLTSCGYPCATLGFVPELKCIGMNDVNCEHHGILQTNTSRCTVVLHEGVIHVGGGTTGKSKENLCKVLVYNPDTHSVSTINAKAKFFSLVVINNKLTTVGGMDDKIPTGMIYSWDSTAKEWRECCPPMPTARRSTTSITYGNYLIVIGGALSETVTIIEVLDVPNKKWYSGPSLPEQMFNVQAVVVEHSLYLLGGNSISVWCCSLPTLITGAISTFYNLAQLWKRLSSLPYRFSAAALLGKHLLAIGGCDEEAANMTDLIHCYSPENNCWEKVGVLRTGRRNCTAIKMLNESVFVIGGADSPAYNNYCQNVEVVSLHIKQ